MPRDAKPKAVFTYCFQIWMTGLLLGPVIGFFGVFRELFSNDDWLWSEFGILLISLLVSIPGIIIFSGGAAVLFLWPRPIWLKRILLTIWGALITIGTFWVLFDTLFLTNTGTYPGSICYVLPSAAAVWIYSWPGRMK